MVRFSFVVPVFNGERYLKRCMESMLNQSFKDFEIILVDDASKDNSTEIIKKYQTNSNKIFLYQNEKNEGVSYSRNLGIDKAHGEYLIFCDDDDWYEKDALEMYNNSIIKYNSDFIISNYYITYDNSKIEAQAIAINSNERVTKEECLTYLNTTSSAKAIKKDLFIKNKIKYPTEVKQCEELSVIPILAYKSKNPIYITNYLYHYYQNKKSVSNTKIEDYSFFDSTFKDFVELIDKNTYYTEIEFKAIEQLFYGKLLSMLKSKASRHEIIIQIEEFKKEYPKFLKNKYLRNYHKAKLIFIKALNYKMLFLAKIYANMHGKLTG